MRITKPRNLKNKVAVVVALALPLSGTMVLGPLSGQAEAKGCLKGAVVGAVAGKVAHHGIAGALAGCAAGHALAKASARAKTVTTNPVTTIKK